MKSIIILILPLLLTAFSFTSDKTALICKKWEYVSSRDPYRGGISYRAKPNPKKYLIFHTDGSFEEIDPWNYVKGTWKLNADETKIGIAYAEFNGKKAENAEHYSFDRNITSITETELKFWILGRHGKVTYTYKVTD